MSFEQAAADYDKTVLIVEDEPDNREILRTVVEDILGFNVALAADGRTAVHLASTLRPALILMDLMIPVLDGFEAIAQLKSEGPTAGIPVIAISALGRPSDRQRALQAGADGYVSKPFDVDALAAAITEHAARKSKTGEE